MKLGLVLLVFLTLLSSPGRADSSQGQWSWESFKTTVITKFHSFIDRFSKPEPTKEASAPVVAPTAPVQVAPVVAPADEEPIIVQASPKAKKAVVTETKPAAVAKPVEVVAAVPEKKKSWFDFLLNRVSGTQIQTQAQNTEGVSEPVPQAVTVQESPQTVPVAIQGSTPSEEKKPGMFERLKLWVSGLTSTRSPASVDEPIQAFPQGVKIQNAAPEVNAIIAGRVATPAIPFKDDNLIMGHNDVPVFRFKALEAKLQKQEVKRIPLLNLGQEEILDSNAFKIVSIMPYPEVSSNAPKSLDEPDVASKSEFKKMLGDDIVQAAPAEKIEIPILEAAKKVTGEKIAKLVYTLKNDESYTPLVTIAFTEEDLKLLRGLILFEKKDQCHIASGIFSDLVNAEKPDVNESARFHLGVCLKEMNLPTEALHYLTKEMRSKNSQIAHDSIKSATDDVQLQYEATVVEALLSADQNDYPKESLPQINYLKAKYFIRKNLPGKALEAALLVPEKTPQYYKAQYVAAVAEYELGRVDASLTRQKSVTTELSKNGKDNTVLALFEMNLGRESFQKAKYKDSLEAFQKVPKENSLWIQSLIEEGWVQLQSKDMPGAIGNMHSIQSPYFSGVYKPESYVLRSIAYLSICQYADAFKSIAYLEHFYQPWLDRINKYNSTHNSSQTYQTVFKQLQGKANLDADELPYQAIREAARQRDFLNAQESINQLIDENSGYPFVRSLIEKDRKSLLSRRNATILKVAQLREKIRKVASIPDGMRNYNSWRFELSNLEDFLTVYEFKVKTLREGLDGLNKMIPQATARIAANKDKIKDQAGKILKDHFVRLAKDLRQNLDNDELLKYEVYAGSGENLRFKIAGGKTLDKANLSNRQPAGQHWDFDGEYWEDEIGNYRSSLKNNCQNNMAAGQKGRE